MIGRGTIVGKRYRVGDRIARGGMAEVWAAVEEASGIEVVVKTPRRSALLRSDLLALFEREAALLGRIHSKHVAKFYGYFNDDVQPFIVCERLIGETLGERLRSARVLTVADLGPIVEQVLAGLRDAHESGVIHRDLSPDNVFLCGKPEVAKLIDFGVGKPLEDPEPMTPVDATIGSFAYMAPEQWLDPSKVDARTDLYALGTIVFRSLSGSLPFPEKNAMRLLTLKKDFDAPTLSEFTHAPFPATLQAFVAKSLARAREDRFATATAMADAWRQVFAPALHGDGGWITPTIMLGEEDGNDATATMTRAPKRRT